MKVKWGLITLTILFVAWGIFALAAEYGTQSDPLVSLSYITDVFRPDLLKRAENESKSRAAEVQSTVDRFDPVSYTHLGYLIIAYQTMVYGFYLENQENQKQ